MSIDEDTRWALLLKHQRLLTRLARRLSGDSEDARDLLQDLLILVVAHPTGPADEAHFYAWCRGMMRNIALHHRRSKTRRFQHTSPVGMDILEFPEPSRHGDPEIKVDLRKLLEPLGALDESSRELLQRRYVLGETASEIASSLKRSPEAIRMRLMRLRAILRGGVPDDALVE